MVAVGIVSWITVDRLAGEKAGLEADLATAGETNEALTDDLATTAEERSQALAEGETLRAEKAGLEADLAAAGETNEALTDDLATTAEEKAQALAEGETLRAEKAGLEVDLAAAGETNAALTADLLTTAEEKAQALAEGETLRAEKAGLEADLAAAGETNAALTAENADLTSAVADLESSAGRLEELEAEIERLEELREPLIPNTTLGTFVCTGSMEPVITCLDEATYLVNFRPEDIIVGAVIGFLPLEECDLWGGGIWDGAIVHRVKDIKVEDGVYWYWPQGDNNSGPDNCWIPEGNVGGYITELHKDVRPEKADLRSSVNQALTRQAEALAAYEMASTEYHYYCATWSVEPGDCVFRAREYQRAKELLGKAETARLVLNSAIADANCWLSAALLEGYSQDGEFYFLNICTLIKAPPLS